MRECASVPWRRSRPAARAGGEQSPAERTRTRVTFPPLYRRPSSNPVWALERHTLEVLQSCSHPHNPAPLSRKTAIRPCSGACDSLRRVALLRCERPREPTQRLVRGHAAGPETASYEERRHVDARRDGKADTADSFRTPAIREADDHNPRVTCGFENAFLPRGHENGLRDDSDDLLNEERARASGRLASRRPSAGSASVPRSRSVVPAYG